MGRFEALGKLQGEELKLILEVPGHLQLRDSTLLSVFPVRHFSNSARYFSSMRARSLAPALARAFCRLSEQE